MLVRLQKYLADHGVASRRKCEEYIQQGLIKVNGKVVTEMGVKVDPEHDVIETAPELVVREQRFVYYMLHKPVGYVCSVTGPEEPKITELLKAIPERVFPVGRLDKLSSGLLLITNDGRFAYEMTHPKFGQEKEYVVKVREKVTPFTVTEMEKPFYIQGKLTAPATIRLEGPHMFHVLLTEGRNRQIRRMCEKAGLHIERLKRIRIKNLALGDLPSGEHRILKKNEVTSLTAHIIT